MGGYTFKTSIDCIIEVANRLGSFLTFPALVPCNNVMLSTLIPCNIAMLAKSE